MMTKEQLQQELKAKLKEGVKPSHLKRSKSLDDLSKPTAKPLNRSSSAQELEPANSKVEQLETKVSVLELQLETSQRELSELNSLQTNNSFLTQENSHLKEQMKVKHKEIELLRKQKEDSVKSLEGLRSHLESLQTELNSLKIEQSTLLDANLVLKHESLKDWFQQYERACEVEKELASNIEYASNKSVKQDKQISTLQSQITKLKQTNQSLEKDLNLAQKLAELRRVPYFESEFNFGLTSFKYAIYVLLTVWFCFLIRRKGEIINNEPSFRRKYV